MTLSVCFRPASRDMKKTLTMCSLGSTYPKGLWSSVREVTNRLESPQCNHLSAARRLQLGSIRTSSCVSSVSCLAPTVVRLARLKVRSQQKPYHHAKRGRTGGTVCASTQSCKSRQPAACKVKRGKLRNHATACRSGQRTRLHKVRGCITSRITTRVGGSCQKPLTVAVGCLCMFCGRGRGGLRLKELLQFDE